MRVLEACLGAQMHLVFGLTLVALVTEDVRLVTLLSLLAGLHGSAGGQPTGVATIMQDGLAWLGVANPVTAILVFIAIALSLKGALMFVPRVIRRIPKASSAAGSFISQASWATATYTERRPAHYFLTAFVSPYKRVGDGEPSEEQGARGTHLLGGESFLYSLSYQRPCLRAVKPWRMTLAFVHRARDRVILLDYGRVEANGQFESLKRQSA